MSDHKTIPPDILRLYTGAKVIMYTSHPLVPSVTLKAVSYEGKALVCHEFNEYWCLPEIPGTIRPILRSIASITLREAATVLQMIIHPHVTYPDSDYRLSLNDYGNPEISINNDWFEETLVIGKIGGIWSKKSPSSSVKVPATVYTYLFSLHFDFFELIKNGLAIESPYTPNT